VKISRNQLLGIKCLLHLIGLLPLVWLVFATFQGGLSADPAKDIQHFTGLMALKFLLGTLLVSPLARYTHTPILMRCRRLIGIWCFAWAALHLTSYALLELGLNIQLLGSEIVKRPYLAFGLSAWIILFLLALTSFRRIQSKMGRRWQQLHTAVYLCLILVPIHDIWSVKILSPQPIIYTVLAVILLLLRWRKFTRSLTKR
jgi:sulfoxide reductase heme-binding subunit YedZ